MLLLSFVKCLSRYLGMVDPDRALAAALEGVGNLRIHDDEGHHHRQGEGEVDHKDKEEGGSSSVEEMLTSLTSLPPDLRSCYAQLLAQDGATTVGYLVDAAYTKEDLLELGIKRPHIPSILRAISSLTPAYKGLPGPPPSDKEGKHEEHAPVRKTAASSSHHVLIDYLRKIAKQEAPHFPPDLTEALGLDRTSAQQEAVFVVAAMKAFPNVPHLQTYGCWALATLASASSKDGGKKVDFGEVGGYTSLLTAFRAFPHDHHLHKYAMRAVVCMANGLNPDGQQSLGMAGVPELVVAALKRFVGKDRDVVCVGCRAMIKLANGHEGNRKAMGAVGGCEVVVRCLQAYPRDREVQSHGCAAIRHLAEGSGEHKAVLGQHGACEVVVAGMKAFQGDREVQHFGCSALVGLGQSCPANMGKLRQAGAYPCITGAMTAFPQDLGVQQWGCRALSTFTLSKDSLGPDGRTSEEEEEEEGAEGGLVVAALLVAALMAFPKSRDLVCHTLTAMVNLVSSASTNATKLAQGGGFGEVVRAVTYFRADREIQSQGLCLISCLLFPSADDGSPARSSQEECGACCQAVVGSMKSFGEDRGIQLYGCCAFRSLAFSSMAARKALGTGGGCERLAHAMRAFPGDRDVQYAALGALINLGLSCPGNAALMGKAGMGPLAVAAMEAWPQDQAVQHYGCWAISSLCFNHASTNAGPLGKAGACERVVQSMAAFASDQHVQHYACYAIHLLATADATSLRVLKQAGALEHVEAAVTHFPGDDELQRHAQQALEALSRR